MPRPLALDRKILPDDLPRIIQLYQEGKTQVDIGMEYDVDHSTIHYYLIKAGVVILPQSKKKQQRMKKRCFFFENEKKQKSYKQYLEESKRRDRIEVMHMLISKKAKSCVKIDGRGGEL